MLWAHGPIHSERVNPLGANKFIFKACHLGKLKLEYTVLAQTSFQLARKTFWWAEFISQYFCNLNSSRNFTCLWGKLRTKFTSPVAKSTSHGLSDCTFFACWSIVKNNYVRLCWPIRPVLWPLCMQSMD